MLFDVFPLVNESTHMLVYTWLKIGGYFFFLSNILSNHILERALEKWYDKAQLIFYK